MQTFQRKKAITFASSGKSPLYWAKFITDRGVKNWKPAQKHNLLVPAAFIRQVYKVYQRKRSESQSPEQRYQESEIHERKIQIMESVSNVFLFQVVKHQHMHRIDRIEKIL